ncbi:nuclease Le1 [Pholiota conissans]|uniref:Nuclease Le1 n=1 Tax=Pholiota conissans TaxID=109636 RepID=A0A9P5Z1T6_9AGAR|nr:nuclease Le1 [Pholiota conissans]
MLYLAMKFAAFIALASSFIVPSVYGWGANGHMTVGFVAMEFLAPNALSFVQKTLGATYNESLGPAATWADDVRSEAAFSWSAPFHFVDAEDNPPTSCSVSETRDCGNGKCILTAIANYTTRVVSKSLSAEQIQEALKFIDHFVGDIGQPLHVEALEVGGNDISAKCNGASTNLHATWDTGMINVLLKANYQNSVNVWADTLVTRIKTGEYKSLAADWISCSSTTEPLSKRSIEEDVAGFLDTRAAITPLECPLVWATESNAFDCSFVFSFTSGEDLCTSSYFTGAVPIIETQIAKQGFRLAAWLNVLFDGATNLP